MNIAMYHIVFRRLRLFYAGFIFEKSPFYNDTEIWFRPVRVTFSDACTHLLHPNAAPPLFRPARGIDAPALRLSSLYSRFVVPAALWETAALNTKCLSVAGSYIHWLASQLAVNRSSVAPTVPQCSYVLLSRQTPQIATAPVYWPVHERGPPQSSPLNFPLCVLLPYMFVRAKNYRNMFYFV